MIENWLVENWKDVTATIIGIFIGCSLFEVFKKLLERFANFVKAHKQ